MSADEHVFRIEESEKALIVIPTGDHIGFRLGRIQDETQGLIERFNAAGLRHIVVDASETVILSSSVIGAMIEMWEAATGNGGKFVICGLSDDALQALVTTRLDTRWPHYATRDDALAALG